MMEMDKENFNAEVEPELDINELLLFAEKNEKELMEMHGIYSNAVVCMTSWDKADLKTISKLEGENLGIAIDGELVLEMLYGEKYSNVSGASSKKSRKNLIAVDEKYLMPQTEDNQWIVEKVLAKRQIKENRVKQYLLKWKGWGYESSTWEDHCKENTIDNLIKKFTMRQLWKEIIRRRVPNEERIYYYNNYMNISFNGCHLWEDEMNKIIKEYKYRQEKIYVENWIDAEAKPPGFIFTLENKFSMATEKAFEGIHKVQHCICKMEGQICGSTRNCCPEIFNQNYCYTEEGSLNSRIAYKEWIVECTDACGCDLSCLTRVVQRGRKFPIVIFRTLERGWSVRTCVSIKKHEFVCEYIGEVLTVDEALESKQSSIYQFQMDAGSFDFKFIVDAAKYGNEARFINHSCNPNLVVRRVFGDRLDLNYFRIAFFAKRDIGPGDELTIDYQAMDKYAKGRRQKVCRCKSKMCKGVYYY